MKTLDEAKQALKFRETALMVGAFAGNAPEEIREVALLLWAVTMFQYAAEGMAQAPGQPTVYMIIVEDGS